MFATIAADVVGYGGLPLAGGALLAAAVAAFLYVPLFGKQLAVGLIALAAATFAFDLGFNERASLDKSAVMQSEIIALRANARELQRQADATKEIAASAKMAEQNAEDHAAINQQKVDEYAAELAKTPTPACGLTDADVSSLRDIGAAAPRYTPEPPKRPASLWPASPGPGSP
jgi:hypothetical protein